MRNISNPIITSKLIFSPPFHYSLFRKTMKRGLTAYPCYWQRPVKMKNINTTYIIQHLSPRFNRKMRLYCENRIYNKVSRARFACLSCKRPRDGSLSLPLFREPYPPKEIFYTQVSRLSLRLKSELADEARRRFLRPPQEAAKTKPALSPAPCGGGAKGGHFHA